MKGLIPTMRHFCKKHGATLLTIGGVIGVVGTAVEATRATVKAVDLLQASEEIKGEKLTKKEMICIAGPLYIPTVLTGLTTIGCIFGANHLNKRQQAMLMGVYSMLDNTYKTYRNKVKEIYGEEGDCRVIESIANDHMKYDRLPTIDEDATRPFMDMNSLQLTYTSVEDIREIEQTLNELLQTRGYVRVCEYNELLAINSIEEDYITGWVSSKVNPIHGIDKIEIKCTAAIDKNGDAYHILEFIQEPIADYMF